MIITYPACASEVIVERRMKELGISGNKLAALAGVPANRLTQAFQNIRAFDGDQATKLLTITAELEELVKAAAPFRIPLDNVEELRRLMVTMRLRSINPEQLSEALKFLKSDE
jgi:hypothetical protein